MKTDVSTAAAALAGVKLVSIALNLPGPTAARRLADWGATVLKVEPPEARGGDPLRHYAPDYYRELHAGIAVETLNLKSDDARAVFEQHLAGADMLLTSQREAALARLGLDWPALHARLPQLCAVAIVGSATSDAAGHDLTYVAAAGLATPPTLPPTLVADLAGAERAVAAAFAVLRLRQQQGIGAFLRVSLEEAAVAFAKPHQHGLTNSGGILGGGHPGYNFYRAEDGWVALAALEPHFLERVAAAGSPVSISALGALFGRHSCEYWSHWAVTHDIPLAVLPSSLSPTTT